MRPLILISTILFAAILVHPQANGADWAKDAAVREEIERLEVEWNTINELSDPVGKERLLALDSYHVGPSGRIYNRVQDVEAARHALASRKLGRTIRFDIRNKVIRLYKDVAVVTGTGRTFHSEAGVTTPGNSFRFVHVWEKTNFGWVLAVDQVTGVQ